MFVQEVIAAMTISPSLISNSSFSTFEVDIFDFLATSSKTFLKFLDASFNNTLSCGLFGPEIVGTTDDISRVNLSVKTISSLAHKPCSLA